MEIFKTSLRNGRAATWQKRNVCNWTNIDRCLSHIRTSPHRRTYISFLMLIFSPLTLTKTTKNNLVCYDRFFLTTFSSYSRVAKKSPLVFSTLNARVRMARKQLPQPKQNNRVSRLRRLHHFHIVSFCPYTNILAFFAGWAWEIISSSSLPTASAGQNCFRKLGLAGSLCLIQWIA